MKKDYLVVILIVCVVMGGGYYVHSHTNVAYSSGNATLEEEVDTIKLPFADKVINLHTEDFVIVENKKEEEYSLQEVYDSIMIKDEEGNPPSDELINIYNDFYKYFSTYYYFKNYLGENYTYYEYMNIKNNFKLDKNFGTYIAFNSKCNVFFNVLNDNSYCL